ncbi:MAG: transposase [Clostridia bacterium]
MTKFLIFKILLKILLELNLLSDGFTFELKQLIAQIQFLESQLKDLDNEINSIYTSFNCYLSTIPGISNTLAPIILSEIGDINKFSSPSKLVAFAGIDPSINQSGEFVGNENAMSKRGSPFLRRALFLAAFVAENNDPSLKAYYQKKINEGKHHYVATGTVTRKLVYIIYGVLKEQRPFKDF